MIISKSSAEILFLVFTWELQNNCGQIDNSWGYICVAYILGLKVAKRSLFDTPTPLHYCACTLFGNCACRQKFTVKMRYFVVVITSLFSLTGEDEELIF